MAQRLAAFGTKLVTKSTATTLTVAKAAQPHLTKFWGHAKVELGPPGLSQWPQIKEGFSKLFQSGLKGNFLDTTVRDATRNTLVAIEIACWFYVGEIIGRRSLIGYKV